MVSDDGLHSRKLPELKGKSPMNGSRKNRINTNLMLATAAALTAENNAPQIKVSTPRGTLIEDTSGQHPGAIHGPKIKNGPARIAKGTPVKTTNPGKKSNRDRVIAGRLKFLKTFGAKAYLAKFDK
jgi:hypothetical protein